VQSANAGIQVTGFYFLMQTLKKKANSKENNPNRGE
jgi:hypothetical protein